MKEPAFVCHLFIYFIYLSTYLFVYFQNGSWNYFIYDNLPFFFFIFTIGV